MKKKGISIKNMFKRWLKAFLFDESTYKDAENTNIIELIIMFCFLFMGICLYIFLFIKLKEIHYMILSFVYLFMICIGILFFIDLFILTVLPVLLKPKIKFSTILRAVLFSWSNYMALSIFSLWIGGHLLLSIEPASFFDIILMFLPASVALGGNALFAISLFKYLKVNADGLSNNRLILYTLIIFFLHYRLPILILIGE